MQKWTYKRLITFAKRTVLKCNTNSKIKWTISHNYPTLQHIENIITKRCVWIKFFFSGKINTHLTFYRNKRLCDNILTFGQRKYPVLFFNWLPFVVTHMLYFTISYKSIIIMDYVLFINIFVLVFCSEKCLFIP